MKRRAACLLMALAVPMQASAHPLYASRAEVEAAVDAAATEAKIHLRPETLIAALQQAQVDSNAEPLRAEAGMQQILLRLREAQASAAARKVVESLLDHSPRVFTEALDPEQRGRTLPAFAVAGGARAVLRNWDDRADIAEYRKALAQADFPTLRAAGNPRMLAELVREADDAGLRLLQQADLPQVAARQALFERIGDVETARLLLRAAPDAATQQLAAAIVQRLPADAAFSALADPQVHERRRSASRLAIGTLVAAYAPAREHLLSTLGDAHGASSAAALARQPDGATLAALASILSDRNDDARARHALLALRLSAEARATAQLRAFANDALQPPALREGVRSWLD